jgi:hypothetical protein
LWNGVKTLWSIGIHNELSLAVVFGSILYISWSFKRPLLKENTNSISSEVQTYWFQKQTTRNMVQEHVNDLNCNPINFDSVEYTLLISIWLSCRHHVTMLVAHL